MVGKWESVSGRGRAPTTLLLLPVIGAMLSLLPSETDGRSNVKTLAGSGFQGSMNGGSSVSRLSLPRGVAFSPDGKTIAVADYGNHVVRRLNMPKQGWTGAGADAIMSTLAGAGLAGKANGKGTSAQFNNPSGVAFAPDGAKVAVADTSNGLIRTIALGDGNVETIAGGATNGYRDGLGTNALFSLPTAVAYNDKGDGLVVGDTGNNRIRWINLTTSQVTTLSGSKIKDSACGFGTYKSTGTCPNGRCQCGTATQIVDSECARVDYDLAAGLPTVLCHFGTQQATCTAEGSAVTGCSCERPNTGAPCFTDTDCTLGGSCMGTAGHQDGEATRARFRSPTGVAVSGGRVYVADSQNQAIRVINITTGYTSTLAGRIGNVGNLDGKFIVIPSNDPNIIDPIQAAFASPSGIDFFDRFAIVADSGNFKIRRLDISVGEVKSVTGWMTCSGGKYTVYGFCWSSAKCLCNDTLADAAKAAACADGSNPTDTPNDDSPHCRCIPANTDQSCVTTATCTGQGSCTSQVSKGLADGAASSAKFMNPTDVSMNSQGTMIAVSDRLNHAIRLVDCKGRCDAPNATIVINDTISLTFKASPAAQLSPVWHVLMLVAAFAAALSSQLRY